MSRIKYKRVQRAKLCFLYYSLQIFKRYVIEKTMKDIPRYMAKTKIKLGKEESEYYDKFKRIPPSYVRYKGIKYLKKIVAIPIGPIEFRPATENRKIHNLSKLQIKYFLNHIDENSDVSSEKTKENPDSLEDEEQLPEIENPVDSSKKKSDKGKSDKTVSIHTDNTDK